MTVSQLLQHADSRELSSWQVFLKLRADVQADTAQRRQQDAKFEE